MKTVGNRTIIRAMLTAAILPLAESAQSQESVRAVQDAAADKVQKIRFVEDDAQNSMVSKIYELKHQKANDIVPFILGAIKRSAKNGSADRINYSAAGKQLVAVTCPVQLMPYLDDMIAKLDRPGAKGPDGSGIDGTGITRSVYTPVWRSGETMVNVMIKAGISSNASEGANQDAVVALDAATNRIYWKDSINKDADLKKYLAWLDRPVPQAVVTLHVYEVRESALTDLGLDYLAWKNGPGLNLFDAGAVFLEGTAIENAFGPYGFFMFAPAFDLSFLRMLQQDGKASTASSASITLTTGHDGSLRFTPHYQNLTKDDKFASAVSDSTNDSFVLNIKSPVIALSGKTDEKSGLLGTTEKDLAAQTGILNFSYSLAVKNVVERDNHGNELYDAAENTGAVSIQTGGERILTACIAEQDVEQTIGVPFLCELPILKYIFGTTTRTKEKICRIVTVSAELVHPDAELAALAGKLSSVAELVQDKNETNNDKE